MIRNNALVRQVKRVVLCKSPFFGRGPPAARAPGHCPVAQAGPTSRNQAQATAPSDAINQPSRKSQVASYPES